MKTRNLNQLILASQNAYSMGVQSVGRDRDGNVDHVNSIRDSYMSLIESGETLGGKNVNPIKIAIIDGKEVTTSGNTRTGALEKGLRSDLAKDATEEDIEKAFAGIEHEVTELGEMTIDEARELCFRENNVRPLSLWQRIADVLRVFGSEPIKVQASRCGVKVASWRVYKAKFESLPKPVRESVLSDKIKPSHATAIVEWCLKAKTAGLLSADRGATIREALKMAYEGKAFSFPGLPSKPTKAPETPKGEAPEKGEEAPEAPKAPKGEAPKGEAPKGEAPKGEAPKGEAPEAPVGRVSSHEEKPPAQTSVEDYAKSLAVQIERDFGKIKTSANQVLFHAILSEALAGLEVPSLT